MSMPPPRPCRTRKKMSDSADQARPASAHRHVEDRHDGTEHDHARDLQDTLVEALVRYVGCGGHGTSKVAIRH
jgi:hypothetical protein